MGFSESDKWFMENKWHADICEDATQILYSLSKHKCLEMNTKLSLLCESKPTSKYDLIFSPNR
jgi:hypothetical protein